MTQGESRWINLYFETDPIGGPVLREIDNRLPPTRSFDRPPGDTAYPRVYGHSDYPDTSDWPKAITTLVNRLTPTGPVDLRESRAPSANVAADG